MQAKTTKKNSVGWIYKQEFMEVKVTIKSIQNSLIIFKKYTYEKYALESQKSISQVSLKIHGAPVCHKFSVIELIG
jgi:cell fate (sporulation/competence/biofilm development) regulator YmcA (YheA/YmcA/DUF963 family)